MAKLSAWLITIIGILMTLPLIGVNQLSTLATWIIPLAWLIIGISKLMRNYSK